MRYMVNNNIRGYVFSKGFIWIGWILVKREQEPILYSDNIPYTTLKSDLNVEYLTLGISKKRVMKRIEKHGKKLLIEINKEPANEQNNEN